MMKRIMRAGLALVSARPPQKPKRKSTRNDATTPQKRTESTDFGKRGEKMPTAAWRRDRASRSEKSSDAD
ncbi:MAG: hypothetical protein M9955_20250 [Rhizobiaceae bacterium]|nr:hypothetical protein [Rhizobiaceae bacterium]